MLLVYWHIVACLFSFSVPLGNHALKQRLEPFSSSELQRNQWMAVYCVVYHLTYYTSQHPGGSRMVVSLVGILMTTNEFERYHKALDVQKVTQYIVGVLV